MKATRVCKIEGCSKPTDTRGWCAMHYWRWKRNGDPLALLNPTPAPETCTIEGCDRPYRARGWCSTHWLRWKKHGDPTTVREKLPPVCLAPGCDKISPARYCEMHRARLARTGSFDAPKRSTRHLHSQGYQLVKLPDHPLARASQNGWLYEHRAVLFDAIGPGWHDCHRCGMAVSWELSYPESLDALVVDHLDEDKANNQVENLAPACAPCNFARSNRWIKQRRKEAS